MLSRLPDPTYPVPESEANIDEEVAGAIYALAAQGAGDTLLALNPIVLEQYTARDPVLRLVLELTRTGWPRHSPAPQYAPYFRIRDEISTFHGCLLWGSRVVIPAALQPHVLEVLGGLHVGERWTKSFARMHCWFPSLNADIERMVRACETCQRTREQSPRSKSDTWPPAGAWGRLHIDYTYIDAKIFCVLVDAGTGWIDAAWTSGPTAAGAMSFLSQNFRILVCAKRSCQTTAAALFQGNSVVSWSSGALPRF